VTSIVLFSNYQELTTPSSGRMCCWPIMHWTCVHNSNYQYWCHKFFSS